MADSTKALEAIGAVEVAMDDSAWEGAEAILSITIRAVGRTNSCHPTINVIGARCQVITSATVHITETHYTILVSAKVFPSLICGKTRLPLSNFSVNEVKCTKV